MVQVRMTKLQVSRASRFLVGAERSRCHEAVFNRISPSLLDIFHDSRAVSHFADDITPHFFGLSGLLPCGEPVKCHNCYFLFALMAPGFSLALGDAEKYLTLWLYIKSREVSNKTLLYAYFALFNRDLFSNHFMF